jgi:hypothetical protein
MPQFGATLKSLAGKAGIKADDENLKKLLSFAEVAQLELPDEFINALEGNLLTVESAAANSTVRSKLIAEALNGVDSELDKTVNDFEFDDNFKTDWKGITRNTNEKVRKLTAALKTQMAKIKEDAKTGKHDPNAEAQATALKNQITELNKSLENTKTMHQVEIDNLKSQNLNDRKDFLLTTKLSGKPLPKNGLSPEINILTAKTLISQEAAKQGLVVGFDANGQPTLKQRKDGAEIDFFVNNKVVNYDDFIDGVLAQNKFVQVNDSAPTNGHAGNTPPASGAPGMPTNASVASNIDAQLAMLGATV